MPTRSWFPRILLCVSVCAGLFAAEPATPAATRPPPAFPRTLYLIRHGAYDTTEQPGDESTAYGLVPLGVAQARLIAARLRGMPVTFDSLISSTLTRARQTAQVIGQSFPTLTLKTDPLLCECLPPMRNPQPDVNPADMAAAETQLNEAFAKYFIPATDRDRNDIIVAHGNVLRFWIMKALGVDTQAWLGLSIAHCSLTIIRVKPDGSCSVLAVGDTGHIAPNMLSGLVRTDPQLVVP
jgi:serine/threonine-protein phosphatase PGAM5